jgi:hypothetical protein
MWTRQIDLYINLDSLGRPESPLLTVSADSVSKTTSGPVFVHADKLTLNLHFMRQDAATKQWASQQLANTSIVFAGKYNSTLMFSVTSFTEVESSGEYYYSGTIDLNTSALDTALTTAGKAITVPTDLELQNADNTQRATFQFNSTVNPQNYSGGEGVPESGDPAYPSPSSIVTRNIGTAAMTAKTKTIDLTSFALDHTPIVLVTATHPTHTIFATARAVTSTSFEIVLSSYESGTEVFWIVI